MGFLAPPRAFDRQCPKTCDSFTAHILHAKMARLGPVSVEVCIMIKRPPSLLRMAASAAFAACLTPQSYAASQRISHVTPQLIEAAKKEGKVVFYTSMDLQVVERLAKAFEAKYPGVTAQIERTGAERLYQRVGQEYASNIRVVDVIESYVGHLLDWKQRGWLVSYVTPDVARWPVDARDDSWYFAAHRATLSVIAYNTKLVKPEDAPTSYADLLDPKWRGKIVKSHPAYSGNTMAATFVLSRALGWDYFKKLGQQRILQVQSANDPPKKLALGERTLMADGTEYVTLLAKAQGAPVAIVYPTEGTPLVSASAAVMKDAPRPNAARLFVSYLFSSEAQQLLVDMGQIRSFHPDIKEPADRVPLSQIKVLSADPAELEKAIDEIKGKYAECFGT
jgi:iron(III) transport system substrate-binding protein